MLVRPRYPTTAAPPAPVPRANETTLPQELELEMGLLMRLHHPNIVRLIGAGTQPEQFLLIERLDGGTLAQRCGNALKIRDRRRRFRHKRPFT